MSNALGIVFTGLIVLMPVAESQTASRSLSETGGGQSAIEQELIALDKKLDEAVRNGDTALLANLLSDDFLRLVGADVRTKAEFLKELAARKSPSLPPLPMPDPRYTVRVLGDTAVLTHVARPTDPHSPAPGGGAMHVFRNQQGSWKMVGWSSSIAQPSAEQSINAAGYALMGSDKLKEAIDVFKMNVQLYPESWNVYDSLGEAYAAAGETALAIQNYEKSVQINPANETGKSALAKLKGK